MTEFGPDAASFQKRVDWAQVDASCDLGWEKVSQGTGYANPYWPDAKVQLHARAAASGLVPGAYMFLESYTDPAAQAEWFADNAGDLDGFAIAVDAEPYSPPGHPPSRPTVAQVARCAARLRQLYPQHPVGGYLPHWYWDDNDTTMCDWLWASRYVSGSGAPEALYAKVPADWWAGYGGQAPLLLQFTSRAVIGGVAGECDCSAFRGAVADYAARVLPLPGAIRHVSNGTASLLDVARHEKVTVQHLGRINARLLGSAERSAMLIYLSSGDWGDLEHSGARQVMPAGLVFYSTQHR